MAITRRDFLTGVVMGFAGMPLFNEIAFAQARGKVGYMKIVDNASLFMAMEKGFFKSEGLDLELLPMVGGAAIAPAVASGDLQVGWSNVISLYQAHVEGFDFKLVSGGAINVKGSNETHAIQVLKDSPIKTARDLEGKTVAVNTLNNIVHLMAMAWIDKNGGSVSKVKFVEIPFPQMEAALSSGRVDAASTHEPFVTASTGKGVTRVLSYNWGEVVSKFLIASWFASDKWIKKNQATVSRFVRAVNRGIDAINADIQGTRKLMIKWTGLSPELAKKVALPVFEKGISEKDLQVTIDLTHRYKLVGRSFKAKEVISELAPKA
ncbi:MAG: ABC transporter substrate-binding protein [Deltaproteobacteria bacterium]|nr:ABC transporter substrate-binding protein [Deltaproteobacteria bacterium]